MERSDIEAEVGRLLNDPNHDRWSTDTIRARIEEAQTFIQALTNAVKTVETLTPTAETKEVAIDETTLDISRVTIEDSDGVVHILQGRSEEERDFYDPNWENADSGQPREFSYDASNHNLILYPKPDSDWDTTDCLKVWEVRIPTALTADDSEPFNSNAAMQAYANSIVHWVVAQCWMDDGTQEGLLKSKFHKSGIMESPGEFEKYIKLINGKFDSPVSIPARVMWYPEGGRISGGSKNRFSKSNPFGW